MSRRLCFITILSSLALLLAVSAMAAGDRSFQMTDGSHGMLHGGADLARASRDTTWLLGGPGSFTGKFQDAFGSASWQGWTHTDVTYAPIPRWNVADFNDTDPAWGDLAIWCGVEAYPNACADGYGNNWQENLVFAYTVTNPNVNTIARLECAYRWDTEPGFDYVRIQQNRGGTWETLIEHDAMGSATFDQNITFTPSDYVGAAADQLELRFQGVSDGAWSDEDCLYDTEGLAQVDNIRVTIGGNVWYEDHEDGDNDHWVQIFRPGVGDFAQILSGLQDVDPCVFNNTPQAVFIDDGVVVPGTGGTSCVTWCYGPGGYTVNNTGGLAGPDAHVENLLLSPVLVWPAGNDAAILTYDVYRHEDLVSGVSPGIFYQWHVRSTASGDSEELLAAAWEDRNFVYYGRSYLSDVQPVTDLLEPGRTHVQVALRCIEYGWVFGYEGVDGTPAPYFDNVAFKVFPYNAPSIAAREIDLANDNFPARGDLDLVNLANNGVRFDMARSISPDADMLNQPGDSIFVDIGLPRAGSVLNEMPKLVVKMKANPLFDGVRVLPPGFAQVGDIIDGWVYGDSTFQANGTVVANRYNFDLPDEDFFFPGDVIHYYIEASDYLAGDVGVTTLPADISHIGDFAGLFPYGGNSTFIVRALPSVLNATGDQPEILFWNDFANRGGENEWTYALHSLGYSEHREYDIYYTNGPSSGVGNGLGGRATSSVLEGYVTLLYTSGDLGVNTIANNDYGNDPSNDIGVLSNWFQQGGKQAFLTGDDLVFSLNNSGGAALTFVNTFFSTRLINNNLLPLINNQTAPTVVPLAGNSVFSTPDEWIAYGGCPGINDFDAIETNGTAERLAQFLTPSGNPGYTYAAATRYTNVADVIVMPHDFMFIHNPPGYVPSQPGFTVRAEVLRDVLIEFGHLPGSIHPAVPDGELVFGVSCFPNPFNPRTTIALDLPAATEVSVQLYDIRGRLVRTLQDGPLPAGPTALLWQGDDDAGRALASGVYFYEVRAAGEERIGKLALVR